MHITIYSRTVRYLREDGSRACLTTHTKEPSLEQLNKLLDIFMRPQSTVQRWDPLSFQYLISSDISFRIPIAPRLNCFMRSSTQMYQISQQVAISAACKGSLHRILSVQSIKLHSIASLTLKRSSRHVCDFLLILKFAIRGDISSMLLALIMWSPKWQRKSTDVMVFAVAVQFMSCPIEVVRLSWVTCIYSFYLSLDHSLSW